MTAVVHKFCKSCPCHRRLAKSSLKFRFSQINQFLILNTDDSIQGLSGRKIRCLRSGIPRAYLLADIATKTPPVEHWPFLFGKRCLLFNGQVRYAFAGINNMLGHNCPGGASIHAAGACPTPVRDFSFGCFNLRIDNKFSDKRKTAYSRVNQHAIFPYPSQPGFPGPCSL